MKLTLEQKAFYEYGRAVESLKRTIYETRETAIQEFKDPYRFLSTYDRKQLIDAMGLASEISAVRQKRAACRAWKLLAQRHCQPLTVWHWPSLPGNGWKLTSRQAIAGILRQNREESTPTSRTTSRSSGNGRCPAARNAPLPSTTIRALPASNGLPFSPIWLIPTKTTARKIAILA